MPVFVARSTPVPHQVEVVEFFAKIAVRLGRVVNIERFFRRATTLAPNHAIRPRCPPTYRPPNTEPVVAVEMLLVLFPPTHQSAFRPKMSIVTIIYPTDCKKLNDLV